MRYKSDSDFRTALEERLRQRERQLQQPLVRLRKRLVFERCMSRLQRRRDSPWILKGGFALELRLGDRARMTKDLDLGVDLGYFGQAVVSPAEVVQALREVLAEQDADRFIFLIVGVSSGGAPRPRWYSLPLFGRSTAGRQAL